MKKKEERPVIFKNDNRFDLSAIDRRELVKHPRTSRIFGMCGTKEDWTIYNIYYVSVVLGPKSFWKRQSMSAMSFKNGKVSGDIDNFLYSVALEKLGMEWASCSWIFRLIRNNKTLLNLIFSGKITSQKELVKKYSKLYFSGKFTYKNLKKYFDTDTYQIGSLWEIYFYTSNPDLYLERMLGDEPLDKCLMFDILRYCAYDNTKLNPNWSDRRLSEFHQAQIEKDLDFESKDLSNVPIARPFTRDGFTAILSDRAAFMESSTQHNCAYRCYWPSVKSGNYLLFSGMADNKRVTLGINVENGLVLRRFIFDQVRTMYNGNVSPEEEQRIKDWIETYASDLNDLVDDIRQKYYLTQSQEEELEITDIPF